jgi:hypothetical protein
VIPFSCRFDGGEDGSTVYLTRSQPVELRKLAKAETDRRVARRMLGIANALSGMSREDAARSAGMDRQTLRD